MTLIVSWITGMNVGIEFFSGEDLEEGDKFAMCLNLAVIRVTLIISE